MFEKRRSEKRKNLIYYLEVYDNENGELVGHVADITKQGVLIISEHALELDKIYSLKIILPDVINGMDSIIFDARCVHGQIAQNKSNFDVGLKFVSLDGPFSTIIERLKIEYGFAD